MKTRTKPKLRSRGKVKKWVQKGRKKVQEGGFLSLIIAGLVSLGVAAETAASVAAVAAPIATGLATGAAGAVGAKIVNSMSGEGKRRTVRRISRRGYK
jgi:VIT1/CCC1 family predicted Fe2+/Mn2+ transporter